MTQKSNQETGGRYDSTRKAWEEIWDDASIEAELKAVESDRAQETINAYLPFLNKDDLILEAGSGLSAVIIALRRMGYNAIGMDYAENALHASRHYQADLPLLAGDVHALPLQDASIGAYLSFGVLEHFEHGMQPALAEAWRTLKPGGVLVLTIPYPNVVWHLARVKRKLAGQELINEDFYESTYNRDQLIFEVTRAGFSVAEVIPTSHSFTLWGLGGPMQGPGYYETSPLAENCARIARRLTPWALNFMTLIIAHR